MLRTVPLFAITSSTTPVPATEEPLMDDDDENAAAGHPFPHQHEAEIVVPGPFVVLQGNAGDGMSNTVGSSLPIPGGGVAGGPSHHSRRGRRQDHHGHDGDDGDNINNAASFVVVTDDDNQDDAAMTADGSHDDGYDGYDDAALQVWMERCRKIELRQRRDWRESLHQVPSQLLDHCMMAAQDERDMWWQVGGRVAVLRNPPEKLRNGTVLTAVIGTLDPGSTVIATGIVELDSSSLQRVPLPPTTFAAGGREGMIYYPRGRRGAVQMVQLETAEGRAGYAVLSLDGYPLLAPGLLSDFVDPTVWIWRVTCPAGAYLREGLDLNTRHIATLPYGSLVRVVRRTINNQGLSRLRTHGTLDIVPLLLPAAASSSSSSRGGKGWITMTPASNPPAAARQKVDGWCSELLNPLSGQRGIVAQPLPFPVPALYRVTLSMGAVIRKDVELSSPELGLAPFGSLVKVVGRAFSEHPVDMCIERLKLAGGGGWISVRLNRPPPHDDLVVELVDVDGQFDPAAPGRYHLDTQRATRTQRHRDRASNLGRHPPHRTAATDLSSIDEDDLVSLTNYDVDVDDDDDDGGTGQSSATSRTNRGGPLSEGLKCVVCLTSDRNATIVHGETGHVVCCLVCSRILYARGDKCPVCRLNIDVVIQHFYA